MLWQRTGLPHLFWDAKLQITLLQIAYKSQLCSLDQLFIFELYSCCYTANKFPASKLCRIALLLEAEKFIAENALVAFPYQVLNITQNSYRILRFFLETLYNIFSLFFSLVVSNKLCLKICCQKYSMTISHIQKIPTRKYYFIVVHIFIKYSSLFV